MKRSWSEGFGGRERFGFLPSESAADVHCRHPAFFRAQASLAGVEVRDTGAQRVLAPEAAILAFEATLALRSQIGMEHLYGQREPEWTVV
jgi:hypothetical protein